MIKQRFGIRDRKDISKVAPRQFVQTTFRTIAKNPTFRTWTIGTKMKPDISYKRHFVQN